MSTFDDEFAAAVVPDHLARFGRPVQFHPADGPSRSVRMILSDADKEHDPEGLVEREVDRLWCQLRKDESHADGGIGHPQPGDRITHPDETDDTTPFSFAGEIRRSTPTTWELLFTRRRDTRIGIPE